MRRQVKIYAVSPPCPGYTHTDMCRVDGFGPQNQGVSDSLHSHRDLSLILDVCLQVGRQLEIVAASPTCPLYIYTHIYRSVSH